METISDRLQRELAERNWSRRQFQMLVREAASGARGTSYASVYDYIEGGDDRPDPPLTFLRAAAGVLGVREAWLTTGRGPRSDAEEEVDAVAAVASEGPSGGGLNFRAIAQEHARELYGEIVEGLGLPVLESMSLPHWMPALVEVERRLRPGGVRDLDRLSAGREPVDMPPADLVAALRDPLEAFGLDLEYFAPVEAYMTAMVPVLLMLARERDRQRWVKTVDEEAGEEE